MYVCMYIYVCVCIYIYICHNLFIHSSVVEHLGYFYLLAVVNNTAMNWYTRICLQTPLAAQWIRICLPMQGTRFQSLVLEDSTCHEATKAMRQSLSPGSRARQPQLPNLRAARTEARMPRCGACVLQLLKRMPRACMQNLFARQQEKLPQ